MPSTPATPADWKRSEIVAGSGPTIALTPVPFATHASRIESCALSIAVRDSGVANSAHCCDDRHDNCGGLLSTNFPFACLRKASRSSAVLTSGMMTTSPSTGRPFVPGLHAS